MIKFDARNLQVSQSSELLLQVKESKFSRPIKWLAKRFNMTSKWTGDGEFQAKTRHGCHSFDGLEKTARDSTQKFIIDSDSD